MKKVPFDIPTIKELEPELNRCFGFTFDDISIELSQVYIRRFKKLTQKEKEFANQCKSKDSGRVDAVKFALSTKEQIYIAVPDDFNLKEEFELCSHYLSGDDDKAVKVSISFMAALFCRDRIKESISGGENDNEDYQKYVREIRPDMLKLYVALHNSKRHTNELTIKIAGDKPFKLKNYECWFEYMLKDYLDHYLGVGNVKEAERELNVVYGNKVGYKVENKGNEGTEQNEENENKRLIPFYTWGVYQLLKKTKLQPDTMNGASAHCCEFILCYLMIIGLIKAPPFPTESVKELDNWIQQTKRTIRSKINYYIKENLTIKDILDSRDYKSAPNNTMNSNLW